MSRPAVEEDGTSAADTGSAGGIGALLGRDAKSRVEGVSRQFAPHRDCTGETFDTAGGACRQRADFVAASIESFAGVGRDGKLREANGSIAAPASQLMFEGLLPVAQPIGFCLELCEFGGDCGRLAGAWRELQGVDRRADTVQELFLLVEMQKERVQCLRGDWARELCATGHVSAFGPQGVLVEGRRGGLHCCSRRE